MHVRVDRARALAVAVVALAATGCATKTPEPKPTDLADCSQQAAATYDDCAQAKTATTATQCGDNARVTLADGAQMSCADYERYHRDANHTGWELDCQRKELGRLRSCAEATLAATSKGGTPEQCADAGMAVYNACVARYSKQDDSAPRYDNRSTGRDGWERTCQRQKAEVRSACMDGGKLTMADVGMIPASQDPP